MTWYQKTAKTLWWVGVAISVLVLAWLLIRGPWFFEGSKIQDAGLGPAAGVIVASFRTMVVALVAGAVAALGIWYTRKNHLLAQEQFKHTQEQFELTQRQFEHTQQKDREEAQMTREAHVTEQYVEAIKLLSSENVTQRIGGVYSLERIMHDSEKDHSTIVEVLSAFVRGNTGRIEDGEIFSISQDAQAAMSVLGRRPRRPERGALDLRGAYLCNAKLEHTQLPGTDFTSADLRGVDLSEANLSGSDFSSANLSGAMFVDADLRNIGFFEADFSHAVFDGANLPEAHRALIELSEPPGSEL